MGCCRVSISVYGAASNNRLDILSEMRLAALLAKGASEDASTLPAHTALRMATLNAATALGLDQQIGSIQVGKQADLCAIDLGLLHCSPCFDPISHLVYVASRSDVTDVWVAGTPKVRQKSLCTCNMNKLKKTAELWQNSVRNHPQA